MNFINGVCLILFSISCDQSTANPCEDNLDNPDIWDTHVYTDKLNTEHCFFRLSDRIVNTTWTFDMPDWAKPEGARLLSKTKCQEVCAVYGAHLPILLDKDVFEFFLKVVTEKLINGGQPLGVTPKKEVSKELVEVEWDNGIKGQINARDIYGTKSIWVCCDYDNGQVVMFAWSTGQWMTVDHVSLLEQFYIVCHYDPNHVATTSTKIIEPTATSTITIAPETATQKDTATTSFEPTTSSAQSAADSGTTSTKTVATATTSNAATSVIATSATATLTNNVFSTSTTLIATGPTESTSERAPGTSSTQTAQPFSTGFVTSESLQSTTDSDFDMSTIATVPDTTTKTDQSGPIALTTQVATTSVKAAANRTTMKLPTTNIFDIKGNPTPSSGQTLEKVMFKPIFAVLLCALYFCVKSF